MDTWFLNLFRRKAVANQEGAVGLFFDQLLGSFQQGLWKAQAIVKTAAPLVLTDIGMGRDKLLDQVGIGAMKLDSIKASLNRPSDSREKVLYHLLYFSVLERPRLCQIIARSLDSAGCYWLTVNQIRQNHATTMIELDNSQSPLVLDGLGQTAKPLNLIVLGAAEALRKGLA